MRARHFLEAVLFVAVLGILADVSPSAQGSLPAGATDAEAMVVPGGTPALLAAARLPASVEPARAWLVLARVLHGGQPTEGTAITVSTLEPYLAHASALAEAGADRVPALLPNAVWEQAVFNHPVAPAELAFSILRDRRAALLYVGLFSLDPATLDYFAAHPALVTSIYNGLAGPLAAFGEGVAVRADRVELPGGSAYAQEWEKLVGVPAGDPDRFIPALLGRDGGRLAWLCDTLSSLDQPRLKFALGGGLQHLYEAFGQDKWPLDFSLQPFRRPPLDFGEALATIGVDGDGRMLPPRDQRVWGAVLGQRGGSKGEEVTGTWLLRALASSSGAERRSRLASVMFAQRVFGARGGGDRTAAEFEKLSQAIDDFRDRPAVMLTLERLGFSDPVDYVSAARAADAVASGADRYSATLHTAIFQGALAIVTRMSDAGTIGEKTAQDLVRGLLRLSIGQPAPYAGSVIRWLEGQVLPALPPTSGADGADADSRLLDGLSGAANGRRLPTIEWEDYVYRVDPGAGERSRLRRVRERQGGGDSGDARAPAAAEVGRQWRVRGRARIRDVAHWPERRPGAVLGRAGAVLDRPAAGLAGAGRGRQAVRAGGEAVRRVHPHGRRSAGVLHLRHRDRRPGVAHPSGRRSCPDARFRRRRRRRLAGGARRPRRLAADPARIPARSRPRPGGPVAAPDDARRARGRAEDRRSGRAGLRGVGGDARPVPPE